jgi:hypothetical protein
MSRSVLVPEDVYEKAAKIAAEQQVPVGDVIAAAFLDQMAAQEYIARRAARSSKESYLSALDQIGEAEPTDQDRR